ncbi:MAG: V-type ATP synthase subunit B, partial [Candidatus Marinimicrobia bacterium]|nr:V-type ATP synthase subunit B [Candidatus Neomarinimicrobiota bacterium]
SNRGYPGDLYSQLASRYEKAVDFEGAGSLTILAVTTMPGDDVTHPVPDNTGYITEGQFYLRNGRIEPFGSLSRLKQQVNKDTREDHRAIMDGMIQLYAQYMETEEKRSMGFRMSTWDRKLLKYGGLFEKQMMDLSVNISLEDALDQGWKILAECFESDEAGFRTELIRKFWPAGKDKEEKAKEDPSDDSTEEDISEEPVPETEASEPAEKEKKKKGRSADKKQRRKA